MSRHAAKNTKQLNLEVKAELLDAAKAFADGRGETLRAVFEQAIARHMAHPPVLPQHQPLPLVSSVPAEKGEKPAKKGKAKKK